MTILRRHGSNVYVASVPPDVLHGIYPDENGEMQGVLVGQGALSVARVSDIWLPDYLGVYNQFLGGDIGYRGGQADLDPAKFFGAFTVTATTPAPLSELKATFNDGSTHREKYSSGSDYLISDSIASEVSNTYRPPDGWEIGVYLGNVAAITHFYCNGNQLTGSIPDLSANTALTLFYCHSNQLTGSIPDLSANTALVTFYCYINDLTGSIPDLSANNLLTHFRCHTNSLTGPIPDLSANTALVTFYCYGNQLTGSIPDLSANTALTLFYCQNNQLTGFDGGWPNKAFSFIASGNDLTEAAVNQILIDADTYGIPVGTTITLTGGTNAAPTGAGVTAKNNLIANGATVSTN